MPGAATPAERVQRFASVVVEWVKENPLLAAGLAGLVPVAWMLLRRAAIAGATCGVLLARLAACACSAACCFPFAACLASLAYPKLSSPAQPLASGAPCCCSAAPWPSSAPSSPGCCTVRGEACSAVLCFACGGRRAEAGHGGSRHSMLATLQPSLYQCLKTTLLCSLKSLSHTPHSSRRAPQRDGNAAGGHRGGPGRRRRARPRGPSRRPRRGHCQRGGRGADEPLRAGQPGEHGGPGAAVGRRAPRRRARGGWAGRRLLARLLVASAPHPLLTPSFSTLESPPQAAREAAAEAAEGVMEAVEPGREMVGEVGPLFCQLKGLRRPWSLLHFLSGPAWPLQCGGGALLLKLVKIRLELRAKYAPLSAAGGAGDGVGRGGGGGGGPTAPGGGRRHGARGPQLSPQLALFGSQPAKQPTSAPPSCLQARLPLPLVPLAFCRAWPTRRSSWWSAPTTVGGRAGQGRATQGSCVYLFLGGRTSLLLFPQAARFQAASWLHGRLLHPAPPCLPHAPSLLQPSPTRRPARTSAGRARP